jgi:hypothetical protein
MLPRQRLAVARLGAITLHRDNRLRRYSCDYTVARLLKGGHHNQGQAVGSVKRACQDQCRYRRGVLRDELKALTWLKTAYGDSGFATGFFRYLPSGATGALSVTLKVTPVSRPVVVRFVVVGATTCCAGTAATTPSRSYGAESAFGTKADNICREKVFRL